MRSRSELDAGSGAGRSRSERGATGGNPWAVVLAAGEGTRLSSITRNGNGRTVPKQFCSLDGESTLLDDALARAARVAPPERTIVIVAAEQEHHWKDEVAGLPGGNVVVQPRNRGTAPGVLLPTLTILARDPNAHIVYLPSDHFVADEDTLANAIVAALADVERRPDDLVFLGIEPDEADSGLGYIAPDRPATRSSARIARFIEKPEMRIARSLIELGALWNSFIFAAAGRAILEVVAARIPAVVNDIAAAMASDDISGALSRVYARLPSIDFSSDVIQGSEHRLRVRAVPACGWSDLGTPERLGECLNRFPPRDRRMARRPFRQDVINLAEAYVRFSSSSVLGSVA